MKLKVVRQYIDIRLGRKLKVGETIDVDDQRGEELLSNPAHIVERTDIDMDFDKFEETQKLQEPEPKVETSEEQKSAPQVPNDLVTEQVKAIENIQESVKKPVKKVVRRTRKGK